MHATPLLAAALRAFFGGSGADTLALARAAAPPPSPGHTARAARRTVASAQPRAAVSRAAQPAAAAAPAPVAAMVPPAAADDAAPPGAAAAAASLQREPAAAAPAAAIEAKQPRPDAERHRGPAAADAAADADADAAQPTRVARVDPELLAAAAAAPATRYALPPAAGAPPALAAALAALADAGALLRGGGLVGLPTETVYGLAANALDAAAVARIFRAKGRPADNPLIVHVSDMAMLASLYPGNPDPVPAVYAAALAAHWPGPLTVLLPASPLVPPAVTAGHPTMAVRMPSHPVARAAIAAAGVPLAAPSANSSGRPSPTRAEHVVADLAGRVPLVIDGGACGCGVESTVLDGLRSPPAVLRPGGVPVEALAALPGLERLQLYAREFTDASLEAAPTTPGMKYRHYSPSAPVLLVELPQGGGGARPRQRQGQQRQEGEEEEEQQQQQQRRQREEGGKEQGEPAGNGAGAAAEASGRRVAEAAVAAAAAAAAAELAAGGCGCVALLRTTLPDGTPVGWLQRRSGGSEDSSCGGVREYCLGSMRRPVEVARALFAALRDAEAAGVGAIVVEGLPDAGEGAAVMNRLRKAASSVRRAAA
ncbi:translation factor [Raphidocelis subcapitata]|uniref:Threonylcarbamoyl-AMP synthase n=1 Tax=Raphidocelis subcapitata TaxID=307507 RepID=A0A2V0PN88_9CHLO|nr:translation factor [Raphidocelis subcapitata]|eukprot:GBF98575.1 translation factor [Raphidocelis subcapitata]